MKNVLQIIYGLIIIIAIFGLMTSMMGWIGFLLAVVFIIVLGHYGNKQEQERAAPKESSPTVKENPTSEPGPVEDDNTYDTSSSLNDGVNNTPHLAAGGHGKMRIFKFITITLSLALSFLIFIIFLVSKDTEDLLFSLLMLVCAVRLYYYKAPRKKPTKKANHPPASKKIDQPNLSDAPQEASQDQSEELCDDASLLRNEVNDCIHEDASNLGRLRSVTVTRGPGGRERVREWNREIKEYIKDSIYPIFDSYPPTTEIRDEIRFLKSDLPDHINRLAVIHQPREHGGLDSEVTEEGFINICTRIMKQHGWNIAPKDKDTEATIFSAIKDGKKVIVLCKRRYNWCIKAGTVDFAAEERSRLEADFVIIVTNVDWTKEAETAADKEKVRLTHFSKLGECADKLLEN